MTEGKKVLVKKEEKKKEKKSKLKVKQQCIGDQSKMKD